MNVARPRTRPLALPAPATPELPSNVVQLRPGFVLPVPAPEPICTASGTAIPVRSVRGTAEKAIKQTLRTENTTENDVPRPVPYRREYSEHADVSCTRANAELSKSEFAALVVRLSAMELIKRFPLDYSSFKNMKGRGLNGCEIAPEFRVFRSFLRHMGVPRPSETWTLDRINPFLKRYGPGLCRWAPKEVQANNRTDTIYLTGADGRTLPLTKWAELTKQDPQALRKRRRRHPEWSDVEVIGGEVIVEAEPATAVTVSQPAPVRSADGRWPTGATPSYWEAHWQAFAARYHKRYRVKISRHVLFAWIVSNKIHVINERLAQKYPGHMDPNCAEDPPDVSGDPDHQLIEKFTLPWGEALCAIDDVKGEHGLFLGLKTRWRFVVNPEQLAGLVFDRPEDPGW